MKSNQVLCNDYNISKEPHNQTGLRCMDTRKYIDDFSAFCTEALIFFHTIQKSGDQDV